MAGIVILLFSYVLSQFYRAFLAVLSPILQADLGASATELSNAAAAWFIVFALMQFPVGALLDRIGPKITASSLFLICGAGGITLFATATTPFQLIIAMALIGAGCSPVLMATFYIFARTYSERAFATLAATFVGVGTFGNIGGTEPLALAVDVFGWRQVAFGLAAMTAAVGIGILVLVKDPKKPETTGLAHGSLVDILKIRALWLIFPMVAMGYGVAASLRGLWAGPFLSDMYGLNSGEIGRVTLYMAIALAAGSIAYGPLDRLFATRKWVVFLGSCVVLAAVCAFFTLDTVPLALVTALFVTIGFFGSGYAVQVAHGRAFIPAHLTGRGVTLLNFFAIGGVGALQWASGYVVEYYSAGSSDSAYDALFVFFAVTLAIAMALYLFSTDAPPKKAAD